ncbi:hypothetical protein [Streptomyces sp. NPDC006668]|uniref:MmyB family transcriptional regulator n=1 Tax=Streptomyces sp. NPDC006668 TaxID=3156903 RepID=UPI0033D7592A
MLAVPAGVDLAGRVVGAESPPGLHPVRPTEGEEIGPSPRVRTSHAANEHDHQSLGVTRIVHPTVGTLSFDYHALAVPARPDRTLLAYLPQPESADALDILLSWTAEKTAETHSQLSQPGH